MSKIAVFGGTGYVGSALCELLLQRGYSVRMLVRDPEKAGVYRQKESIEVVEGALPDYQAIKRCIEGTEAVISVTGQRGRSKDEMWTLVEGNRKIITAMEELGVRRLIKLSATSVRLPGEPFPLMRRLMDIAFKLLLPNPTCCKYMEQGHILSSHLDWTMVRPPAIVPRPVGKTLKAHEYRHLGLRVYRDDLCNFLIDQLKSSDWHHRCPVVGY